MLLTTLVLKHQTENVAQPEKPPMFKQAHVETCAPSRAASVHISSVATGVEEKLQRHHYRSLSEANLVYQTVGGLAEAAYSTN